MLRELPAVEVRTEFIAFSGGLDVVSPPLSIPPGYCRDAQNYEVDINGGYARISGYERYSGMEKPSAATYGVLTVVITGTVAVGDVLTDDAATSYGTVIALPSGQAILTLITGVFATGNIKVGVTVVGTCTGPILLGGASTTLLNAQYTNLAADVYRALIREAGMAVVTMTSANPGVVTWTGHGLRKASPVKFATTGALPTNIVAGTTYYVFGGTDSAIGGANIAANTFKVTTDSAGGGTAINTTAGTQSGTHTCTAATGTVLGVWVYNDVLYAAKNLVGSANAGLFKATALGWVGVPLYREVSFTAGSGSIVDGQTVTETTGTEVSTIMRVVVESGSLSDGDAAGRLIVTQPQSPAGTDNEFEGGAATTSGGGTLTLSGVSSAISFQPNGRFEFENANFGGSSASLKMYGCDGASKAFEFDGTTLVPIATGMTSDAPLHLCAHMGHLFLSFAASVQHSRPGFPYEWSVVVGAGEIAVSDNVTGFKSQPGGAQAGTLAVFSRNSTSMLYGTSALNWNLVQFKNEAGAFPYTVQTVGHTILYDDRGIGTLATSQAYGNFEDSTLSKLVKRWLTSRVNSTTASCIMRDKNQYRLFFSDGSALFATLSGGKVVGMMPILYANPVKCACSAELSDGSEAAYFGAADGYVYQMDKGTSIDGANIEAFLYLAFDHSRSPRLLKRYRHATFEIAGDGYSEFSFSYELGYATTLLSQPGSQTVSASLSPSRWDEFTWDNFYWDGVQLLPAEVDMTGTAENVSIIIRSNSDYFAPHKISGAIIHYSPRRQMR